MTPEQIAQFPIIAVIVVLFTLVFGALGVGIRWSLAEYKKFRDTDLAWRAEQNAKRELAVAAESEKWRQAMAERDRRYEQFDKDRQVTMIDLTGMIKEIASMLKDHDFQAKEIKNTVERIDHQITQPLPGRRKAAGD